MKYAAFLSYSHRDNPPGRPWAGWLHEWLERFKVPADLAGTVGRYGEPVPSRLFPIFQDDKELPTNADLGQAITQALEQSRYLVVICSPNAAASVYVNEEVLAFKRLGRANRILAIMIAGEPNASDPRKGIDPALECFPLALRHPVLPDGTLDLTQRVEPIAADARGHGAGLPEHEALRIAAGLLGIGFDDLIQRDKARQLAEERARTARFRKLAAGFATLALLAIGAGSVALFQRAAANRERIAAVRNLAESDFREALRLIADSRRSEAVAYLARSVDADPSNHAAVTRLATLLAGTRWMPRVATLPHDGYVHGATFSPGGRWIATASEDKTAKLWDGSSGRLVRVIPHPDKVRFARFSSDGRLVTASDDLAVRVWSPETGALLFVRARLGDGGVNHAEISPDGKFMLLGYRLPYIAEVIDMATGIVVQTLPHDGSLLHAAYLSDTRIVTGTSTSAWIWNARTGRLIARTSAHPDWGLLTLEISPDKVRLLTAGWDRTARVFSAADGSPLTPVMEHAHRIMDAAFSPDGSLVVTGSWDRTARIWDARTGVPVGAPLQHDGVIGAVDFSADGTRLLTGSLDGAALQMDVTAPGVPATRVWDAATRLPFAEPVSPSHFGRFNQRGDRLLTLWGRTAVLWNANDSRSATLITTSEPLTAVDVSADGQTVAAGTLNGRVELRSAFNGTLLHAVQEHGPIAVARFDPRGRSLLTVTAGDVNRSQRVSVWHAATGRLAWRMEGAAEAVAWDPSGRFIAIADAEKAVTVWDWETGRQAGGPYRSGESVLEVQFSQDGARLVTVARDHTARVWTLRTGAPVTASSPPREGDRAIASTLSPDGSRFLTASESRAWIRDTSTGAVSSVLQHENRIHFAVFSPDGARVVTSSRDGTARMWDAATGRPLGEPLHHDSEVGYLAFSPDGRRLATSTITGVVRVWDVRAGIELMEPERHEKTVFGIRFTPDGNRVVSISADGTLRIRDIAPSSPPPPWLPALAAAISQRRLDGAAVTMLDPQVEMLNPLRAQLSSGDDPWTVWGRWLLSDPAARPRSPFQRR